MAETQKLKVFISWAGERANAIGAGFHEFLPEVVNAVQPFMSGKSIDKGTRWSEVLNSSLQESPCAIVCLTRESMQSIWVAFEAGAISKAAGGTEGARSRIWTYLSGIEARDLQLTPFAEYQATNATEEETFRVIESINRLSPDPVSAALLKRRYDAFFWPSFSKVLNQIREMPGVVPVVQAPTLSGPDADVLSEILNTIRSVQRDIRSANRLPDRSEASRDRRLSTMLSKFQKRMQGQGVRFNYVRDGTSEVFGLHRKEQIPIDELEMIMKDDESFFAWLERFKLPVTVAQVSPPQDSPKV